jgi:capsular polysaccharide transport system permease protein
MSVAAPPPPGAPGWVANLRFARYALAVQWRVWTAILLKESNLRRGRSFTFGWLIGATEPLIIIGAISLLFILLGRAPAYGTSMLLFTGSGVFPMYLMIYGSIRVREPMNAQAIHRYPLESPIDEILIHCLLHVLATSMVGFAYFFTLYKFGVNDAKPHDIMTVLAAGGAMTLLGLGLGVLNSIIARFIPLWATLWPGLIRGSIHFSGIYIVVDFSPPNIRKFFDANPLLNGVNWFRHGFYPHYPDMTNHPVRVMLICLSLVVFGLALERVLRVGVNRGTLPG